MYPSESDGTEQQQDRIKMPSLIRFLVVVGVLIALVYGAIFALARFVEPTSREMTITIPRDLLTKPR
jgi:hypothetical protein